MTPLDPSKPGFDFLTALYAPYADEAAALRLSVEVRSFAPEWDTAKRYGPRRWFPLTEQGFAACAVFAERIAPCWDTYMGVLPRVKGGGDAQHLRRAAWLWVDMDAGEESAKEAAALLTDRVKTLGLPTPALLVRSGGGIHGYWRLARPVSVETRDEQERFRRVLQRLVLAIGGDLTRAHACPKATDCARILRLPGTFNLKIEGTPRPVRVLRLAETPETMPLVWFEAHLPALPLPPRPKQWSGKTAHAAGGENWLSDRMLGWLTEPAAEGSRHYGLVGVAVRMRKHGQAEETIRAVLVDKARASGVPVDSDSHQQRHIDEILRWAVSTVQPEAAA